MLVDVKFNWWKLAFFVAISFIIWERLPPISLTDLLSNASQYSRLSFPDPLIGRRFGSEEDNWSSAGHASEQSSDDHSAQSAGHGAGHPHDALFFMFNALIVGTIVLHLTMHPKLHALQQTVCLFVLGLMYSLVQEGCGVKDDLGVLGTSHDMWMNIDPHLLLFTMLPALLAGDAMTIDTTVARFAAKQCMFLAGPGVLFGSFVTASFLYGYFSWVDIHWNFTLCLVCGSILAATDPVAVVGLLKELGASPTLTIQIQGESLLNDGTAIVLYTVAYNILSGKQYDATEIMIYLVLCVCCAIGLGIVLGFVFYFWIKAANNRLDHNAGTIQTVLSICCAYWAFCIAEGAFKWSGVLCTVSASLVLADKMWQQIVDKESLLHIWHMIEYLGNTIIFFLAGALTGKAMVNISAIDYLHLIVIYVACLMIRATLIFGTRPILNCLGDSAGQPISLADATVMTWGGLRGAVGLALAIQVNIDKADDQISEEDGRRVLFYVGGVAALTLMINAPTCPALVRRLGITKTLSSKQQMLYRLHANLRPALEKDARPEAILESLQRIIVKIGREIDQLVPNNTSSERIPKRMKVISAAEICERFENARARYQAHLNAGEIDILDMPSLPFASLEEEMMKYIRENDASPSHLKATYEAFLSLVRHHYWKQISAGEFVDGTGQGQVLLNSLAVASSGTHSRLHDFKYVLQKLIESHAEIELIDQELVDMLMEEEDFDARHNLHRHTFLRQTTRKRVTVQSVQRGLRVSGIKKIGRLLPKQLAARKKQILEKDTCLIRLIVSPVFLVGMSFVLVSNAIFIVLEQTQRKGENYGHMAWLVIEMVFANIFFVEFVVKLLALRCFYFMELWNWFDFLLVILSVFGIVTELLDKSGADDHALGDVSNEARLFRLNRVFRVLRIIRVFRLFKFAAFFQSKFAQEDFSFHLAEYMKTITVCRAFSIAHTRAQSDLALFFGKGGEFTTVEQTRCALESQTEVYLAMVVAALEARAVHGPMLVAMKHHRDCIKAGNTLRYFLHDAHGRGVITAREAATLITPIEQLVKFEHNKIKKTVCGRKVAEIDPQGSTGIQALVSSVKAASCRRTSTDSFESIRSIISVAEENGHLQDVPAANQELEEAIKEVTDDSTEVS